MSRAREYHITLQKESNAINTSNWLADPTVGVSPYTLCFHKTFFPAYIVKLNYLKILTPTDCTTKALLLHA